MGFFKSVSNIFGKIAPVAAGYFLGGPIGAAIGGAAGSAARGGDLTQIVQGAGYGYGAGGIYSAGSNALNVANAASGANLAAGASGPVTTGLGAATAAGHATYDTLVGAAPGVSKVLSALNLGGSMLGSKQSQDALGAQRIGNPDTGPTPSNPNPQAPSPLVSPSAMTMPGSLSSMQSFAPEQVRSALATQGINGGLGDDEQAYYRNLLQRSLIGDGNQVTKNPNFLMPIESSYWSKKGINTSDPNQFLQGISA